jgi:hypothetical protein
LLLWQGRSVAAQPERYTEGEKSEFSFFSSIFEMEPLE